MGYVNKVDFARQVKSYSGDTAILSGNTVNLGGFTGGTHAQFFGTVQGYDAVLDDEFVTKQQGTTLFSIHAGDGISVTTGTTGNTVSVFNGQGLTFQPDTALTLDLLTKTLVNPTISPSWTLYKTDGTTPYSPSSSSSKNITVDIGTVINLNATYQYPNPATTGQTVPTSVSGSFGTTLPAPATSSTPLVVNAITSSQSYSVTLAKPKSGLIVVGTQVQFPTGNDTTSDSISVSYQSRSALLISSLASLTAGDIEASINGASFVTSRSRTFNSVTAGSGQYTYYLLYNALGQPTNVIQNGALPVFNAFQFLSNVNITNAAGATISVIIMRSNATNAFSSATLAFS